MNTMRPYLFALLFCLSGTFNSVSSNAQCNTPTLSVFDIVADSASISWVPNGAVQNYEYAILPATAPAPASGTTTLSLSARVGGLLPGTGYKAWLRSNCGAGIFSAWGSINFSTPCGIPSTISVSNVQGDSADISWTSVSPGANYQYVVDTLNTSPLAGGTACNTNTVRVKNLLHGRMYYVFVRTDCGSSVYSPWSAYKSFFSAFSTRITSQTNTAIQPLSVYPNPVTNVLNVQVNEGFNGQSLGLYNSMGTLIENIQISSYTLQINLSAYPAGMYLLKYTSKEHNTVLKIQKY